MNYYEFMDRADIFFEEGLGAKIMTVLVGAGVVLLVVLFVTEKLGKFLRK